jgi:hypothetical protein
MIRAFDTTNSRTLNFHEFQRLHYFLVNVQGSFQQFDRWVHVALLGCARARAGGGQSGQEHVSVALYSLPSGAASGLPGLNMQGSFQQFDGPVEGAGLRVHDDGVMSYDGRWSIAGIGHLGREGVCWAALFPGLSNV